ncbi:Gfo/Idh/MocA family protein [Pseudonocardia spinosispora]|uniref:Gfo/Idh/MocA family protein n=1 Tax=Pseudonocardia spinosispora TaxID=103441 RepID=UPI000490A173|nr:Gfo/Idh/MocA family oxidoreductase [Pseudonocardia spinosispora]
MTEPLRIGVLGAARIATNALIKPSRLTGDRLVAVAARSRTRAEDFARENNVERALDDYAAVIADDEVEVVYNPLPNGMHGPWNTLAVKAGKHVLSEKPFASNATEARAVADIARASGVTVVEGFHYLHHPLMRRIHQLLDSGELGELRAVEAHMSMEAPAPGDLRWSFELAGGALMDLGCYALHAHRTLAPWTGGEPTVVSALGGERSPGVDEWIDAELTFPNGVSGSVHCSMNEARQFSLHLAGSKGEVTAPNFVAPHRDDRLIISTPAGERTEHLGARSSYTYQLDALRAHLRDGTPFPLDLDDAIANADLIDAVYTAAGFPLRPTYPS